MPLDPTIEVELEQAKTIARRFREAKQAIEARGREIDRQRAAGQEVAERDLAMLSPEGRAGLISELRLKAQADIEAAAAAAREERDHQLELAEYTMQSHLPSGIEEIAQRIEAGEAAARVRSLLDLGHGAAEIVTRAEQLGDRQVLRALRTEFEWNLDQSGEVGEAIAERFGLAGSGPGVDQAEPLAVASGLMARIDDAELALMPEGEREARAAQLTFKREWDLFERQLNQTAETLDTGPQLVDVITNRLDAAALPTTPGTEPDGQADDDDEEED